MARICIVLSGQLGNAPRTVKEATALGEFGHEVTVIAHRRNNAVEERDQDILRTARWRAIRVPFDRSLQWKFARLRQAAFQRSYQVTGLTSLALHGVSAYTSALTRAACGSAADLYIAHYSPALPAAARAARAHGALLAFDAEDFHPGDLPDEDSDCLYNRVLDAVERSLLPRCAYVSAASPGIAELYSETYGIACPTVLLNVFPKANAPTAPSSAGTASPGPSLYWFSQIIGANRGLDCVVRALPLMQTKPHFYMRGIAREDFVAGLRKLARQLGVADRLHVLPAAMPGALERLASQYDLGLSPELGDSRNHRVALGNKLFSYLMAGLPIVASDIPGHVALSQNLGAAMTLFPLHNPHALAGAVDYMLSSPRRLEAARNAAWRLGQERFNWDVEQNTLLQTVDRALSVRRPPGAPGPVAIATEVQAKRISV